MYAETGLLFPCFQNFSPEIYNLDDFYHHQIKPIPNSLNNGAISEYDLGAESDLFRAPEPILEEPNPDLDHMAAAIAMMNSGEELEVIMTPPQDLKFSGIEESLNQQSLLSDVFYECRKDLLAKAGIDIHPQPALIPIGEETELQEGKLGCDVLMQKSVSSGCLSSMEFSAVDFGMRRAFSESDIKTLGSGNPSSLQSLIQSPLGVSNCRADERREQLSRYRNKKMKRNFGRKIKYACRKALADSQPRIRGRFAKTEDQNDRLMKMKQEVFGNR